MDAVQENAVRGDRSAIRLEPYDPGHRDGVMRLCARVFGPGSEAGLANRWRWMDAVPPGRPRPLRWVLLAGDAVVGFLAAVPLPYRVGTDVLIAHTPSEYMVHPGHRFHGIRLMRALFAACPDCVTCDDVVATVRVTEWLGARRVARVVRHTKVLDARVLRARAAWAHATLPGLGVATAVLAAADRLRALRHRRLRVRPLEAFDARFDDFFAASHDDRSISVLRDARFLGWRYGPDSPHADRRVGILEDADGLRGYVVFHASKRQGRVGRILDLQVRDPADRVALEALLSHAVQGLRGLGAFTARFHAIETHRPAVQGILEDHGFVGGERHWLMATFRSSPHAAMARAAERWRLAFGDVEASFAAR